MVYSGWKFNKRVFGRPRNRSFFRRSLMMLGILSVLFVSPLYAEEDDALPEDEEGTEAPAKSSIPMRPYVVPNAEQTRFDALAQQADPREVLELQAGEETFLGLFRPEHTPEAHGALIILHIEDGHPDWPMVVNPVRTQMPDYGWATLSVAIPSPGPMELPERTLPATQVLAGMPPSEEDEEPAEGGAAEDDAEVPAEEEAPAEEVVPDEEGDELGAAEGAEDSADSDTWPPEKPEFIETEDFGPLADRVDARIDAAMMHLMSKGYEQIVFVGHGVGGVWIMDYLKDHPVEPDQAAVMIQPRMPHRDIGVDLPALLLEQQRPILDLYYDDHRFNKAFAVERANFAGRSGNPFYRQTRLGGLGLQSGQTDAKDRRVVQSLRGWLDYLYLDEDEQREPADSYIKGPIRSLYEERMERPRY